MNTLKLYASRNIKLMLMTMLLSMTPVQVLAVDLSELSGTDGDITSFNKSTGGIAFDEDFKFWVNANTVIIDKDGNKLGKRALKKGTSASFFFNSGRTNTRPVLTRIVIN